MKGLLIKDFKILAKQKLFLFLVLLMTVIFTFGSDNNGSGGTCVMLIVSMFSLGSSAYLRMAVENLSRVYYNDFKYF